MIGELVMTPNLGFPNMAWLLSYQEIANQAATVCQHLSFSYLFPTRWGLWLDKVSAEPIAPF